MGKSGRILVADPDAATCELLRQVLTEDGYRVEVATDRQSAMTLARRLGPELEVVVTDIDLDLHDEVQLRWPTVPTVVIASPTNLDEAVSAVRHGAYDYVLRPFYVEDLSLTVACAAARRGGPCLDLAIGHVRRNVEMLS